MELEISKINYDIVEEDIEDNFINKIDLMKDLPIECQIDKYDIIKTYSNLYTWFQYNDNLISQLPEPFYGDYVLVKTMNCINILNTKDLNQELINYFRYK